MITDSIVYDYEKLISSAILSASYGELCTELRI